MAERWSIGVLNTLKVAVIGVVLATILGTLIGIGRLSKNWLLAKLTGVLRRDAARHPAAAAIAVLVHDPAGPAGAAHRPVTSAASLFLSNRGMKLPTLDWEPAHTWAARSRSSSASIGTIAVEPPRAPPAGGDRRPPRRLARRAGCC